MIAHSDNTATDVAMAAVGPDKVRALIKESGLTATRIPHSTRRLFSYLAGAPAGTDLSWQEMQRLATAGPARSPINDTETMVSSAEEMVRWYKTALQPGFFAKPETFIEFKRIQAMADFFGLRRAAGHRRLWQGRQHRLEGFPLFLPGRPDDHATGAGHLLLHHQLDRTRRERRLGVSRL